VQVVKHRITSFLVWSRSERLSIHPGSIAYVSLYRLTLVHIPGSAFGTPPGPAPRNGRQALGRKHWVEAMGFHVENIGLEY